MTTTGDLRAALGMLAVERRRAHETRHRALDAASFAVQQVLLVLEPTGQQYRPTRVQPMVTELHPGFAETGLATRRMMP